MHTLFNTLAAVLPLRYKLPVRNLQLRYLAFKRKVRSIMLLMILIEEV